MKRPNIYPGDGSDAWHEAQQYGIDMSSLLVNLDKTVVERIRGHDRAMALAIALRRAVGEQYGQLRESPDSPHRA